MSAPWVTTKQDDSEADGRFGIGFKIVHSFCDAVEVHAGHYHFEANGTLGQGDITREHYAQEMNYAFGEMIRDVLSPRRSGHPRMTSTRSAASRKRSTRPRDTLLIRGTEVTVATQWIDHSRLRFFAENPRVYSILRVGEREPSQDDIQRKLLQMEHVKELVQDIRRNDGLIDPLIVRDGTLEVWRATAASPPTAFSRRPTP
jgi:hypothetical protein